MGYYRYSKRSDGYSNVIFVISLIIICVYGYISVHRSISVGTDLYQVKCTVTDKGVKRKNDKDKYLVYAKTDTGEIAVYEITDSWVAGRFNSSDVYAGIEIGKKYEFTVGGGRNEFMSWYPNIYEYTEIN